MFSFGTRLNDHGIAFWNQTQFNQNNASTRLSCLSLGVLVVQGMDL